MRARGGGAHLGRLGARLGATRGIEGDRVLLLLLEAPLGRAILPSSDRGGMEAASRRCSTHRDDATAENDLLGPSSLSLVDSCQTPHPPPRRAAPLVLAVALALALAAPWASVNPPRPLSRAAMVAPSGSPLRSRVPRGTTPLSSSSSPSVHPARVCAPRASVGVRVGACVRVFLLTVATTARPDGATVLRRSSHSLR